MTKRNQTIRLLCLFQIILSLVMIFWGIVVEARPHILLDQVLTYDQLQNDQLRESTLAKMQRAVGYDSLLWILAGVLVLATAIIGFRLSAKIESMEQ